MSGLSCKWEWRGWWLLTSAVLCRSSVQAALVCLVLTGVGSYGLLMKPWLQWRRDSEMLRERGFDAGATAGSLGVQGRALAGTELADWAALRRSGQLGPEQRLLWIEALEWIAQDEAVHLTYEISPQTQVERLGPAVLNQTRVVLTMSALHEGHWLAALTRFAEGAGGGFVVDSCLVQVRGERAEPESTHPALPLAVECHLSWYSIVPASSASPKKGAGSDLHEEH